jgi:hypothetical protein
MNHRPGAAVPDTGVYWCTVCKTPQTLSRGTQFPECPNMCGRGLWKLLRLAESSSSLPPGETMAGQPGDARKGVDKAR